MALSGLGAAPTIGIMAAVVTEFERRVRTVGIVAVLLAVPGGVLAAFFEPVRAALEFGWVVFIPATLGYVAAYLAADRRAKRLIAEHDSMICPRCRYLLDDLGESGACPECGRAYTASELRELWHRAYWSHARIPD